MTRPKSYSRNYSYVAMVLTFLGDGCLCALLREALDGKSKLVEIDPIYSALHVPESDRSVECSREKGSYKHLLALGVTADKGFSR